MFPDFPKIKSDIKAKLTQYLRDRQHEHLGALKEIDRVSLFEGRSQRILRGEGDEDTSNFMELKHEMTVDLKDIPDMTLDKVLSMLDNAAEEMAKSMSGSIYGSISEITRKTGNVVVGKGKQITAQELLDVLSKIAIDFDPDGKMHLQIHIHPSRSDEFKRAFDEIETTPSLREQHRSIMENKREEWRAREASRKLVG